MISGQRPPSDWASAHVVTRGGAPVAVDIELALSMGATIATGIIMPSMLFIERFLLPKRVRCHTERTIVAQPGPVTIPSKAPCASCRPFHGVVGRVASRLHEFPVHHFSGGISRLSFRFLCIQGQSA